jgi:hypothetical protein
MCLTKFSIYNKNLKFNTKIIDLGLLGLNIKWEKTLHWRILNRGSTVIICKGSSLCVQFYKITISEQTSEPMRCVSTHECNCKIYITLSFFILTWNYITESDKLNQGQNYKHKKLTALVACSIVMYIEYVLIVLGTVSDCGCDSWLSRNRKVCKANLWQNWFMD